MQLRSIRHDSYDQFAEISTPEIFPAVSDIKYFTIPPVILLQNKVLIFISDVIMTDCGAKLISIKFIYLICAAFYQLLVILTTCNVQGSFWYWCKFLFINLQ